MKTMNILTPNSNGYLKYSQEEFNHMIKDEFNKNEDMTQDDFYDLFHEFVDNAVIYTHICKEMLENNMDYCFEEHDLWYKPKNIHQAAFACLYDYLTESNDTLTFDDLTNGN